jgi:hypothetical protein
LAHSIANDDVVVANVVEGAVADDGVAAPAASESGNKSGFVNRKKEENCEQQF